MRSLLVALLLCAFAAAAPLSAQVPVQVNSLGDEPDAVPGNNRCETASGTCTLRAALQEQRSTIHFSVAGRIVVASPLPEIRTMTTIDATTAPGYTTLPVVVIDGQGTVPIGLRFGTGSSLSLLAGLQLLGFSTAAIRVDDRFISIHANVIGAPCGGTPNGNGIEVYGSASITAVRTVTGFRYRGNVIASNQGYGVLVTGTSANQGSAIADNLIGLAPDGTTPAGNGNGGIRVVDTHVAVAGNVISSNGGDGVRIEGAGASQSAVGGNYIGSDATGLLARGNSGNGVTLLGGVSRVVVAMSAQRRQVISGNAGAGIEAASGTGHEIYGNNVGIDAAGVAAIPNARGIVVGSSQTKSRSISMPRISGPPGTSFRAIPAPASSSVAPPTTRASRTSSSA